MQALNDEDEKTCLVYLKAVRTFDEANAKFRERDLLFRCLQKRCQTGAITKDGRIGEKWRRYDAVRVSKGATTLIAPARVTQPIIDHPLLEDLKDVNLQDLEAYSRAREQAKQYEKLPP
ncbi:unnamed protein product, partial [Mesorhabditis spiculigera]